MSELRILFIGPAGAGKGTQCAKLSEEFGLEHISTGDLIRAEIKSGSELGNKVKSIVEAGNLVSDDIVNEIVKNKLDRTKRFVLDGYPRTKEQAEFLNSVTNLHYIFSLEVNKENLVARLSGRRLCTGTNKPGCKGMFHIAFNPPKVEGKCDLCASDLYQRKDDNPEIIEKRINSYESETGTPLKGFYGDSTKGEFITIEADEAPGMVYEAITSKLKAVIHNHI